MATIETITPPAKSLLKGLRSFGYSFSTAVADIIDNSITARAKNVFLYSDPLDESPYFAILDDGYGMNRNELRNAMLFGSNRDGKIDCEEDLGRFGLGLKSASLSQCKQFVVVSKRYGRINAMSYDLDLIEKTNSWDLQILEEHEYDTLPLCNELKKLESGTLVVWKKFDKLIAESGNNFENAFRATIAAMKCHIEYVFHRFYGLINIYCNGKLIEKRDPFLQNSIKGQHSRPVKINVNDSSITVISHTLPYSNTLTSEEKALLGNPKSIYDEQGFYIYRNKRLIYWGTWMHMGYKTELNKLARIQVDIPSSLDEMWMMDVKKSSAKIPDVIKEKIKIAIEESVTKSKRVIRYRGEKEGKSEMPIWNRIKDRDGFVKYEINRENPLLNILNDSLGENELKVLESFINQIECYLPKGRIQNDNADSINIINSSDDIEESKLIEDVIHYLSMFPIAQRAMQLSKILKCEAYLKISDKSNLILECMEE